MNRRPETPVARRRRPERESTTASADRRQFLKVGGVAAVSTIAGCIGLGRKDSDTLDHAATTGLRSEPRRGPTISEAERVVVVFEDPSCPVCRIFDKRTFPKVQSDLIEPGRLAFFSRGFRSSAPWGSLALRLLEAVFARDPDAFWRLRAYYFANQGGIVSDTLFEKSKGYLRENTRMNPDQVIREASNGKYDDAVRRDNEAGEEAGVKGTPTFFLFESGSYLTKIEGAPSYSMLRNALGF